MTKRLKAYLVTHYIRVEANRLVYAYNAREAVDKDRTGDVTAAWAEDVSATKAVARRAPRDDPE